MQRVRISLTQSDLSLGKRACPYKCPIALAAERAGLNVIMVGNDYILIPDPDPKISNPRRIRLPRNAINFTFDFDKGIDTKPFDFYVEFR